VREKFRGRLGREVIDVKRQGESVFCQRLSGCLAEIKAVEQLKWTAMRCQRIGVLF
jgi:hypothetical protein